MRSTLRLLAAGARANVLAGTRLALFLKVSPFAFRISAGHYATLVLISLQALGISPVIAAWAGMATILILRLVAMALRITLPTYSARK